MVTGIVLFVQIGWTTLKHSSCRVILASIDN